MSPPHPPLEHLVPLLQSIGVRINAPRPTPTDAPLLIGDTAGLACWITQLSDVRVAAHRLARAARCGLVFGCDANFTQLTVATTLTPVRAITVALGEPQPLALVRLTRALATRHDTALERLVACASALDLDAGGRETFRMLRDLLDRGVVLLPRRTAEAERREWVLLQITRLLFLRFVESEGWLDGRPRFLQEELDRCLHTGRDPTRHLLHPLFFGTLNRPAGERSRLARSFGSVPFLNGGLFEPHAIERRHRFALPREFWGDAFAALVDRIDVTLDHAPDGKHVTPEMLGTVFEGVMRPAERRAAGAYFTPPALVGAVVRSAVAHHLAARLARRVASIERALDDPDPELSQALLDIAVLDPAVGSGAFLVGALDVLHGPGERRSGRVRHLVTRRLYGVDRHPGAVRLCEMRLWLEVLRATRGQRPSQLRPLPNLDTTIRAGDVITDPLIMQPVTAAAIERLKARQRAIPATHDSGRRRAMRDLRDAERHALIAALTGREAMLERAIRDLLAMVGGSTLFGTRDSISAAQRTQLGALRRERLEVRRERRRAQHDTTTVAFSLQTAFAPVIAARGGFDLVVGNPPWVRGQHLPVPTRSLLAARFRWWRGQTGGAWSQLPDLCIAFLERGFTSLAPGGTLAMLVPSKLVTASYAASARAALVHHATVHAVADLTADPRAGFDATTYPLAIVASHRIAPRDHAIRLGLAPGAATIRQAEWRSSVSWSTAVPAAQRLLHRLAGDHPPLGASVRAQLGVKTGLNAAFINPPAALREWCVDAVRGADVNRFAVRRRCPLLWPADSRGNPWPTLPAPVAEHLQRYEHALRNRSDCTNGRWWTLFRTAAATASSRVAWSDLAQRLAAVALGDDDPIPLNSCYVIPVADDRAAHALAAWLNSTWITALATIHAESAANGYRRFGARVVASLPCPPNVMRSEELSALGSRAAIAADASIDAAIDLVVADTLTLTNDDRRVLAPLAANRR